MDWFWNRSVAVLSCGLFPLVLLFIPLQYLQSAENASTITIPKYSLGECLRVGKERSPLIRAAATNLRAALIGQKALESGPRVINDIFNRSMPFRREQSLAGINAATAELMQTDYDVAYNITRNYFSVVYAREQLKVAEDLLVQMKIYLEFIREAIEEGLKGVSRNTESVLILYMAEAEEKRAQAEIGYHNALAALKHEMNVPQTIPLEIEDTKLPEFKVGLDFDTVLNHALCRRGEITLAQAGHEVLQLEVSAQNTSRFRVRMPTAAAATDLHYRNLPTSTKDAQYRPDPLGLSLPVFMVGERDYRVSKAIAYAERSEAVVETTRNIIALEAKTEFNRYTIYSRRVEETKVTARTARELLNRSREDNNNRLTDDKQLTYEALATKAFASQNEARYNLLLSLCNLERITAGGIKVYFPSRTP